ncbi:hypothetical protein JEP98_10555 [Providencia rettgeri]|uniref:hypothetical protein n=1 Tax=Providencia rettgeri TaxID=587 RepID=UPI0018E4D0E8|nr:hypothetical protein [Providencia rettgeri]MBI6189597.1 hypothetical protein [Providencia rettgeri]
MNSDNHSPDFIFLAEKIDDYEKAMIKWWDSLQKTRIAEWTFLLTLACWGVSNPHFKVAGICIGCAMFFEKFSFFAKKHTYTTRTEQYLEQKIRNAKVSDNEQNELFKKFNIVKRNRGFFNGFKVIRKTWKIAIAYIYFTFSFFFILHEYWFEYIKFFLYGRV